MCHASFNPLAYRTPADTRLAWRGALNQTCETGTKSAIQARKQQALNKNIEKRTIRHASSSSAERLRALFLTLGPAGGPRWAPPLTDPASIVQLRAGVCICMRGDPCSPITGLLGALPGDPGEASNSRTVLLRINRTFFSVNHRQGGGVATARSRGFLLWKANQP